MLVLFTEITKHYLNFDKLLYNSLAEKFTSEQITDFFTVQKKWQWLGFLFVPIFILLKISIISTIVYIGIFFFTINNTSYKRIWGCVIQAEFIFVSVQILKLAWFYFFQSSYNIQDIQYFMPLSALNIVGYHGLDAWLIYPLQVLNLFELAYIIYLSYQIGQLTATNTDNGLKIVGYSYVPALLLWVTVVMFFTLNYT